MPYALTSLSCSSHHLKNVQSHFKRNNISYIISFAQKGWRVDFVWTHEVKVEIDSLKNLSTCPFKHSYLHGKVMNRFEQRSKKQQHSKESIMNATFLPCIRYCIIPIPLAPINLFGAQFEQKHNFIFDYSLSQWFIFQNCWWLRIYERIMFHQVHKKISR